MKAITNAPVQCLTLSSYTAWVRIERTVFRSASTVHVDGKTIWSNRQRPLLLFDTPKHKIFSTWMESKSWSWYWAKFQQSFENCFKFQPWLRTLVQSDVNDSRVILMSLIYNVSEILLHFVTGLLYMLRTNGLRAYRLCRYFMQTPTSKAFLRFHGE